jgi:hypothetical protein
MEYRKIQGGTVNRAGTVPVAVDQGLRAYMLEVYNWMALGLALTGAVAFAITSVDSLAALFYETVRTSRGLRTKLTILGWVALFAPIGIALLWGVINRGSAALVQGFYWLFAGIMGCSLAPVVAVYTGTSVAKVFFITAATFGAMSLYGYTTKRDLTGWGSFLFMGLIGIIIAALVNLFLQSSALSFAISILGVLIFVGLTAYDTQKIKNEYDASDSGEARTKKAIDGALELYLDFVNIFVMLLRLFGERR